MNDIFKQEWELYLKAGKRPFFHGLKGQKGGHGFDTPVRTGEIRLFADMNRPFPALVIEARGQAGYRIVPISPFTVPASSREMLVGERVFQLWNACTAAKSFTERSWLVATLEPADVAEIAAAVANVPPGTLSQDETAQAYERAFMVSGGNFAGWMGNALSVRGAWWRRNAVLWRVAAVLAVGCGITHFWFAARESGERTPMEMLSQMTVPSARGQAPMLCEAPECETPECEPPACADLDTLGMAAAESKPQDPVFFRYRLASEPRKPKIASRPSEDIMMILGGAEPKAKKMRMSEPTDNRALRRVGEEEIAHWDGENRQTTERYAEFAENEFVSPKSEPLSTFGLDVDTSSYALMRSSINDQKRLPPKNAVRLEEFVNYFKYDYPQPKGEDPIAVDCELAACPWNAKHRLLRLGVQAKTVE